MDFDTAERKTCFININKYFLIVSCCFFNRFIVKFSIFSDWKAIPEFYFSRDLT